MFSQIDITAALRADPNQSPWLISFSGVLLLHALAVLALLLWGSKPTPIITPPHVIGILVSESQPAPVQTKPVAKKPTEDPVKKSTEPVVKQVEKQQPVIAPTPVASPLHTPSERAVEAVAAKPEVETARPTTTPSPTPTKTFPSEVASNLGPASPRVVPPRIDANHLNNPAPEYPRLSRRMGEQGRVVLEVHILPSGLVGEMRLKKSCGYTRLDEAAMKAVRRWTYVPARRGDEAIAYWYVQPIDFVLN